MAATMVECQLHGGAARTSPAACSKQAPVQCLSMQSRRLTSRQPTFGAAVGSKVCRLQRRTQQACRAAPVQAVLEQATMPAGYVRYETMIVLRPDLTDEARDVELAKFEAFLNNEDCKEINALVRGRQPLAYPIYGNWEGIYVLYTYAAPAHVSQAVQRLLSTPDAQNETLILRHMTFRV